MKSFKMLVMILALTVLPWAQTSTPKNTGATAKTDCPCCQKMADTKDGKSCCANHEMAANGKAMSCCSGKNGKSCVKGDKKEMAACGKQGCCGAEARECCKKDGDKSTMACCSGGECGMHHDAAPDAMK